MAMSEDSELENLNLNSTEDLVAFIKMLGVMLLANVCTRVKVELIWYGF